MLHFEPMDSQDLAENTSLPFLSISFLQFTDLLGISRELGWFGYFTVKLSHSRWLVVLMDFPPKE